MNIPVVREGMTALVFDEDDVRETCRMLRCRNHSEDCMALMSKHLVQCTACYAALMILNRPYRIKVSRYMAEQRN
jgi:hypothetical protein